MNLIVNRTFADVERVLDFAKRGWNNLNDDERSEWLSGMKGAYNYMDLNRVESAVQTLSGLLGVDVTVKTDWDAHDIPTRLDIERYLGNIQTLVDVTPLNATVPETLNGMTYETANLIEQILADLMTFSGCWNVCGEIFCGEV